MNDKLIHMGMGFAAALAFVMFSWLVAMFGGVMAEQDIADACQERGRVKIGWHLYECRPVRVVKDAGE